MPNIDLHIFESRSQNYRARISWTDRFGNQRSVYTPEQYFVVELFEQVRVAMGFIAERCDSSWAGELRDWKVIK